MSLSVSRRRRREGEREEGARAMAGLDIMPLQGQKSEEGGREGAENVVASVIPAGMYQEGRDIEMTRTSP